MLSEYALRCTDIRCTDIRCHQMHRHQMPSDAIRCHQMPSDAIKRHCIAKYLIMQREASHGGFEMRRECRRRACRRTTRRIAMSTLFFSGSPRTGRLCNVMPSFLCVAPLKLGGDHVTCDRAQRYKVGCARTEVGERVRDLRHGARLQTDTLRWRQLARDGHDITRGVEHRKNPLDDLAFEPGAVRANWARRIDVRKVPKVMVARALLCWSPLRSPRWSWSE